jgi:hypothetical protein
VEGASYPQGAQPEPVCNLTAPPPGRREVAQECDEDAPLVITSRMRREMIQLLGDDLEPFAAATSYHACAAAKRRRNQQGPTTKIVSCADYKRAPGLVYVGRKPSTIQLSLAMRAARSARLATSKGGSVSRGPSATEPAHSGARSLGSHSPSSELPAAGIQAFVRIHTACSPPLPPRCTTPAGPTAPPAGHVSWAAQGIAAIRTLWSNRSTSRASAQDTDSAHRSTSCARASEASSCMQHLHTCTSRTHSSHGGSTHPPAVRFSATLCGRRMPPWGKSSLPFTAAARRPRRY